MSRSCMEIPANVSVPKNQQTATRCSDFVYKPLGFFIFVRTSLEKLKPFLFSATHHVP